MSQSLAHKLAMMPAEKRRQILESPPFDDEAERVGVEILRVAR